jgi:hypothetical protein
VGEIPDYRPKIDQRQSQHLPQLLADILGFQIHRILAKLDTSASRSCRNYGATLRELPSKPSLVAGEGFEPSKAEPGDLQFVSTQGG